MVATLTMPTLPRRKPRSGQGGSTPAGRKGERVAVIPGRYRPITTHQLCMVWWLYQAGHITKRQLRVYFAAQEMAERRRYTKPDDSGKARRPYYTIDEVRETIGSKHSESAIKELSADVKAVGRLGLVQISPRSIEFARSIDQIAVDDVSGFWQMFDQIKNQARVVPVPRRTCRALAKGMTRGETGMILALVIRSLFWHKREGEYRIDGRTKCSWIAEVFGMDRKTISTARASLIEKGWMQEVECEQWELNKWGQRYRLNLDAFGPTKTVSSSQEGFTEAAAEAGENPSPDAILSVVFPSPCLNNSTSSIEDDLKNRKPDPTRSGFVSVGGREKKIKKSRANFRGRGAMLHDVQGIDLHDTGRLLELHRQAIEAGHQVKGEKGLLDFVAIAERAVAQADNAPKLFAWLLREGRFDFITQADEDAAVARLRLHRNQDDAHRRQREQPRAKRPCRKAFVDALPEDQRFALSCIRVAKQHRVDPFHIARARGWTREQWDDARMGYELADKRYWHADETERGGFIHLMDVEYEQGG